MVQCHFQASWQRGHVRLWRWTGTAANHGGPLPGRRPAAPVRRARSLELQEPDPPVWTVRAGAGRSQLSLLSLRGHFSENYSDMCMFFFLRHVWDLHWILLVLKHIKKTKRALVKCNHIQALNHIISLRAVKVWLFLSRGLRWINLLCGAKWITGLSLWC